MSKDRAPQRAKSDRSALAYGSKVKRSALVSAMSCMRIARTAILVQALPAGLPGGQSGL